MPKNKRSSVTGVATGKKNKTLEGIRERQRVRGAMEETIRAGGDPASVFRSGAARKALESKRKK
jgi:hypothetical protein